MRFKLLVEYAGTRYSGWQIQKNARTVQGEIERALRSATGRDRFELYGSGRTDAGVHALGQVAHLEITARVPPETLRRDVNDALPADIHILSIEPVPHRFHARHDAVARAYLYQISRRRSAFAKQYVWWIREPLDLAAMRNAAQLFLGMQEFASFTDDDPEEKSTTVLIDRIDVDEDGDLVLIRIAGSHFLWKMVRRMVGVLAEVGRGRLRTEAVAGWLTASSHRADASDPGDEGTAEGLPRRQRGRPVKRNTTTKSPAELSAPASGLFLERVYYPSEARPRLVGAAVPVRSAQWHK